MRSVFLLPVLLITITVHGQTSNGPRAGERMRRVRLDVGLGAGGCQGSFLRPIDWDAVVNSPHKAERRSFWPSVHAELEYRACERLGVLVHANYWFNGRSVEGGNRLYSYSSDAVTWLGGGRWYWRTNTPKMEWYSGLMGGWSRNTSMESPGTPQVDMTYFAHQLTFIGFRANHTLAWSVELGQGYKGFLSAGLSLAF